MSEPVMLDSILEGVRQGVRESTEPIVQRLSELEKRIEALESVQSGTMERLLDVTKIVERLVEDQKAVLRRMPNAVVLDKQKVYKAAEKARYGRMELLRALEHAGYLTPYHTPICKRYTRPVRVGGKLIRSIIINIEEE